MEGPSGSGKGGNKKKKGEYMNPLPGEEGDDEYDTDEEEGDDDYDTDEEEGQDESDTDEEEGEDEYDTDDQGNDGGDDEPLEWSEDGQEYVEESEESSEVGETDDRDLDIKDVTVEDEEDRACGSSPYPTDSPISPRRRGPATPTTSSEDTSS